METRGLMCSDNGTIGGKKTGDRMGHYIIPDGLFIKACEDLITQDFTLSWMDRFPPYEHPIPQEILQQAGLPENHLELMLLEDQPRMTEEEAKERGIVIPSKPPSHTGTRRKFRCVKCGSQAWGKPTLKLLCGNMQCDNYAEPLIVVFD